MQAHQFIIQNWDYYRGFINLPFVEFNGITRQEVTITTYPEVRRFFMSRDSLYCYSGSELDLANVANMYDAKIAVFKYSSGGSITPHWTWIHPDPVMVSKSAHRHRLCFKEIWLYNEVDSHYDLLVPRPIPPPPITYNYAPSLSTNTVSSASNSTDCSVQ